MVSMLMQQIHGQNLKNLSMESVILWYHSTFTDHHLLFDSSFICQFSRIFRGLTTHQDFYNFLLDSNMDPLSLTAVELSEQIAKTRYLRYLNSVRRSPGGDVDIDTLMNGAIKNKLKIIPKNVRSVVLFFFLIQSPANNFNPVLLIK